ncbi:MAG: beta-ribofuranosylaminobenzene 5'-phosphate synthase family protein [Alphaproteobacteria bacterium]
MNRPLQNEGTPRLRCAAASISVPARLHLGFLDLHGGLGRRFGSFGITLDGVETRLRVEPADDISAQGPSADRAEDFARRIRGALGIPGGVRIDIEEAIPEHAGLGSGTQLGLAVCAAYAGLYGFETSAREIAWRLGRGARSGIGIGAFELGGVLLDGGRLTAEDSPPAPIISRIEFPSTWRILLILDHRTQGLHGEAEAEAFKTLPPFPVELAAHLCRLVVMVALPALVEANLERFAAAVAELQDTTGDYFTFAQGDRYSSPGVADVLGWLKAQGIVGVGQSSWGPTGFALLDGDETGRRLLDSAKRKWADDAHLRFMLCRGRNRGSQIDMGPSMAAKPSRMGG